jgi:flagellar protein FlgJ
MAASSVMPGIPAAADASTALDRQQAAQVKKMTSAKTADPKEADRVSREFEAMFLSSMLQPMFAGVKTAKGKFGGGHGEETFSAMLVDEYGKMMAKSGGVGIASMVRQQILQMQEVA